MENKFQIEKLSEKNFNEFAKLMKIFADFEKLSPPDANARLRLKKDGLGRNPKYEAYLGKIGGKYVAYTMFFMAYSSFKALPTLFLEDIFILKKYRRKGIGQKMLDFCVKTAKERKCGRIDGYILDWNTPSINFFEKNNAEHPNWVFYRINLKD